MTRTISKTSLRISFVGGGTDIANFYRKYGGEVISTTIDKYITVEVSRHEDKKIAIKAAGNGRDASWQVVSDLDKIQHPLIREAMRKTGIQSGVSIEVTSDISARGTGLGSSSALTVGLLNALYAYQGEWCNPEKLAREACDIEIHVLGNPIGKQDQYIAAYGGLRRFWFERDDSVIVELFRTIEILEKHLMLFYTGIQRSANPILTEQKRAASPTSLLKIRELVPKFCNALIRNDFDRVGQFLHENWQLKRGLAGSITNDQLDTIYRLALDAGAFGGKLLGAGGGGYFLFYAPIDRHTAVIDALDGQAEHTPFRFENRGSQLITDKESANPLE